MIRKVVFTVGLFLSALALLSACTSGYEEEYDEYDETYQEEYDEDLSESDESLLVTDEPVIYDESSAGCLATMEAMLNFDDDDSESEEIVDSDLEFDEEIILVTYQVDGDEIHSPEYADDIPDELVSYQQDTDRHQELWQFIIDIMPADQRAMLGEFIIFSDGAYNVLGAVDDASTAPLWTLEVDIIDSQDLGALSTTLIHEFGHMVTLSDDQVSSRTASCITYLSDDGCSMDDSYINAFYARFWSDIYDDWVQITNDGDEDLVEDFYNEYPEQFVSDYAATNPEEDIAETWTYFIFGSKPSGDSIADQKIDFFYAYPELVQVRQQIINGLCPYLGE